MSTPDICVDSSTLLTYVLQEPRWQAVETILSRASSVVLPAPGLMEVISVAQRKGNVATGSEIAQGLEGRGVQFGPLCTADLVEAADLWEMSRAHPGPKGRNGQSSLLSTADALILAVAQRMARPVITRDAYWNVLHEQALLTTKVLVF